MARRKPDISVAQAESPDGNGARPLRRADREDPRVTQTRELVYAATLEVIAEVGASGVSVERIAERSGVARSTIYRRWPDQAKLYLEAFTGFARRTAIPLTGDAIADLRSYLDEYAARLNDHTYIAVLVALLDRAARDEEFAALYRGIFDERQSRATAILREGIRSGTFRKEMDVLSAVAAIKAPFTYRTIIKREMLRKEDIDAVFRSILEEYALDSTRAAEARG